MDGRLCYGVSNMKREDLRIKLDEVEQTVKWTRPDDTMRFRYGLPEDDIAVHAISAKQMTLDEWFDLEKSVPSKNVWDLEVTIHTSLLVDNTVDEIVKLVLKELPA